MLVSSPGAGWKMWVDGPGTQSSVLKQKVSSVTVKFHSIYKVKHKGSNERINFNSSNEDH